MRPINSATGAATLLLGLLLLLPSPGQANQPNPDRAVKRGLQQLVQSAGGPVGAIATLHRPGRTTVISVGRSNARKIARPRADDHMRIASVAKAFSGAIALRLVRDGRLGLDDTISDWRNDLPESWGSVTVRQMLNHTSGLPDYTKSDGFFDQIRTNPRGFVAPQGVIDWVRSKDPVFDPGSKYEYSNTDNIVVGLISQKVTGKPYGQLLKNLVFRPAKLRETSFPTRRVTLPKPFIHGYAPSENGVGDDLTSFLSPSGAWASGAIVSTPRELGRFIRSYLGLRFFAKPQQRQQMKFVRGSSSPPGPGRNSAGLAIFRYQSRCGTVYGHTGNFPGYVQWAASTANGKRSVTTTLNIPAPSGGLLKKLRSVQAKAVCALLRK